MDVGDTIVVSNCRNYDDVEIGDAGTIVAIGYQWDVQYQVKLVDKFNKHSSKGYYYFDNDDIQKISMNIKNGKRSNKMKKLLKGYKIAEVCFADANEIGQSIINRPTIDLSKKGYLYALYDNTIAEGDIVLCCTGHHGHVIAQVKAIYDIWSEDVTVEYGREIICKIDYSAFEERQAKLKRIDTIKKTISKKKAELDELAIYELLAKQSPEIAIMLKELKELI